MENNNRTILAIALMVLVWSGYSLFFAPQPVPVPLAVEEKQDKESVTSSTEVSITADVDNSTVIANNYMEKSIGVTTNLFDIRLSTNGAAIKEVKLKKYKIENTEDSDLFKLIDLSSNKLSTFATSGSEGFSIPPDLPYKLVDNDNDTIVIDKDSQVISFTATTALGLTIVKNYTFYADTYQVDLNVQLINGSDQVSKGAFNLALVTAWDDSSDMATDAYSHIGPFSFDGEELLEDDPEDLKESPRVYGKGIIWSGFSTKYFVSIVNPNDYAKQIQINRGDVFVENRFVSPIITLGSGQEQSFDYVYFLGPKDFDLLLASGHRFEKAKDFGFFSILAKPLMVFLKFIYGFIGNYGIAIILLTVCIKIVFWPLTQKSYKSMKGMQTLQPQMQKMREKYGQDKQRLNQEMMAFYKENKVNPLGGCLPMLIQIPVFFALYQVLLGAIELRHAPFMLWITDLSIADTLFSDWFGLSFALGPLPLVMGFTMFVQQKMTPTNVDPTQAKLMLMMPVVFTFLFLSFPSGLVLYWLINNLLTILQQYLIKRQPA